MAMDNRAKRVGLAIRARELAARLRAQATAAWAETLSNPTAVQMLAAAEALEVEAARLERPRVVAVRPPARGRRSGKASAT